MKRFVMEGISTGFSRLDFLTLGLRPAEFIVVAGRNGVGKSIFVLNIAEYAGIINKIPVAIYNYEMSKQQTVGRILHSHGKIDYHRAITGNLESNDFLALVQSAKEIVDAPIYIDNGVPRNITELCEKIRKLALERRIRLVIIDCLRMLPLSGKRGMLNACAKLKRLTRETGITVIGVSQAGRAAEERIDQRQGIRDLKNADEIERYADVIITIHQVKHYDGKEGTADISVWKNSSGNCGDFKLKFTHKYARFENE